MAANTDAQKAFARLELDKLHHGMVVELDRRSKDTPPASEARPVISAPGSDGHHFEPNLADALDCVRQMATSFKDSLDRADKTAKIVSAQTKHIEELERDKKAQSDEIVSLRGDLEKRKQRIDTLVFELDSSKTSVENLENERSSLDLQLRQIMEAIRAAFVSYQT